MNRSELTGVIKSRIASQVGCSVEGINEDCTLGHLGLDSLDCVDLCMHIESIYKIELMGDAYEEMYLSDFIDEVHKQIKDKSK